MKLREALKVIIDEGDEEHACRPFCLYSKLADLIGADYCERDKVDLLFKIDRSLSLIKRLMGNDIEEVARIKEEFSSLPDPCKRSDFDEILDVAASALVEGYIPPSPAEPDDFDFGSSNMPEPEKEEIPKKKVEDCLNDEKQLAQFTVAQLRKYCRTHGIKGYSSLNKSQLVRLIMNPNGKPVPKTNAASRHHHAVRLRTIAIMTLIAAVIVGIVCLVVFAKRIQWYQWQHMIGSIGGLLVCMVGFLLSLGMGLFMNGIIVTSFDGYLMAIPIVDALFAIANFVLAFVFGGTYIIIFYWLSGYLLLASLIVMGFCFIGNEKRAGIFGLIDAVAIAGMITVQALIQVL